MLLVSIVLLDRTEAMRCRVNACYKGACEKEVKCKGSEIFYNLLLYMPMIHFSFLSIVL